ncbi:arabinofuranosidase [Bifidobacterium bifidum]|uniref:arabinofuranosidase n=1 Tax=Bifidobacterium bifidum TaxID=1681 RepID=UPI00325168F2
MILLVNRDEHNTHDVTIDLTSLPRLGEWPSVTSSQMPPSDDIYRTNTADEPDGVTLQPLSAALDEGRMTVSLPPVTWASVRFTA